MNKLFSRLIFGIAIATCVSLLFTGCTSTRFYAPSQGKTLQAEVKVGDRVNCRMNDDTQKAFAVTAVEPDALVGDAVRVPFADIASIEITRFDGKKTAKSVGKVLWISLGVAAQAVSCL